VAADSAPANAASRIKTLRSSKGSTKWRRPVGCWSRTRPDPRGAGAPAGGQPVSFPPFI
jgi:hypothetical protein